MQRFKPSTWQQPVQDIVKEYNDYERSQTSSIDVPDKPEGLSLSMLRRGVLDRNTGAYGGNSCSKQMCILKFVPTEVYKDNYIRTFGHN